METIKQFCARTGAGQRNTSNVCATHRIGKIYGKMRLLDASASGYLESILAQRAARGPGRPKKFPTVIDP